MKTEQTSSLIGSQAALPKIRYEFVPDTEIPITTTELAEVVGQIFAGLRINVNDDFLERLAVPTRRHFASTQQHTSPPVTDHEPKPESV